jgi:hypothetical protein
MTQLIAKTRIKFGAHLGRVSSGFGSGSTTTEAGTMIEPGQSFTVDDDFARGLIAGGSAMTLEQARAEAAAIARRGLELPVIYRSVANEVLGTPTHEERVRAAASEAQRAGIGVRVELGTPAADRAAEFDHHRATQRAEEERVARAKARERGAAPQEEVRE